MAATSSTSSPAFNEQRIDYATTLPHSTKILILGAVMVGLFLSALDQTIVSTALPAIVRDFQGIDLVSWVSAGYLLASTATVPVYGKLSDIYGRKAILLWGIIVFLIGSMLCGIAGSMIQLILFRVVQGIGAAAITSTAFATPADLFVPAERPKYMGLFGAVFGLASVVGPFLGGLLTDKISWHWVFFVNLPLGLIALAFIAIKMPRLSYGSQARIDWLGTVLLIGAVVPLMLGLTLDKSIHPWSSPLILGLFAVAIVCTVLFLIVELRVPSPVISLNLFRNRTFAIGVAVSVLNGAAFFGAVLFLSLYLVNVLGLTATEAGITQIPLMVGFVLSSNVMSLLVQRTGRYKGFIMLGMVTMLVGFWLMSRITINTHVYDVAWRVFVVGLGLGPAMPLLNLAVQNASSRSQMGAVTANRQFFQQLGQALGGSIFGVVLATTLTAQLQQNFAPIVSQVSPMMQGALDPALYRNVSVGEGASAEAMNIGEQIAAAAVAPLEEQRSLAQAALGSGDAAARTELQSSPTTLPALRAELEQTSGADAAALQRVNTVIDQAEQAAHTEAVQVGPSVDTAVKLSYTASIAQIYHYSFWLVVIELILIALWLPEIPLAKSYAPEPAVGE